MIYTEFPVALQCSPCSQKHNPCIASLTLAALLVTYVVFCKETLMEKTHDLEA